MLDLRTAGTLLASSDSLERLACVAGRLGAGEASPLDARTRHGLGLDDVALDARIASGPGSIRFLLLHASDRPIRDLLATLAARLATRAPHVLWVALVVQPRVPIVAIAAWSNDRRAPRVRALVADRARIVDSDAETLRALAAAAGTRDLLVHARFIEVLGRDALTARFYRRLERAVDEIARSSAVGDDASRRELALLDTSRLLFLCFLEAKGWLDGDQAFLAHRFDDCMRHGGGYHRRVLRPLFFGTLNTPLARRAPCAIRFGRVPFLNGGLFARTPRERAARGLVFSDDAFGKLVYDLFAQYRFTAAEESVTWSEAAVDPEMLGRAFESLMAAGERRTSGAFFTPFALVERVADSALHEALHRVDGLAIEQSIDRTLDRARDGGPAAIAKLTVLDPACGSGAFLVHLLERIASRVARDDPRAASAIRRDVLVRSIFGVDVNPTAVWLCQLRLWLSVVIESAETNPMRVAPLPNLDRNIRVGDALSGAAFDRPPPHRTGEPRRLRERYSRATGTRKTSLARQLDRVERARALAAIDDGLRTLGDRRRDLISARRGRDLFGERYRASRDEREASATLRAKAAELRAARRRIAAGGALPFAFPVHFADVAARGGFSIVVGNPPWVRMHRIPPAQRALFRREFSVAAAAPWAADAAAHAGAHPSAHAGASDAGATVVAGGSGGFSAQIDLAALFIERATRLAAADGVIALLVPAKLWRSLAGGGVRRFIAAETTVLRVEDYSEAPSAFDAAVYPSLVVLARRAASPDDDVAVEVHHRGGAAPAWRAAADALAFDRSPGAPWILLPPDAHDVFRLLRDRGTPLAASPIGRPLLGVKCGCNAAFVVRVESMDDATAVVSTADGARIVVERAMLRPLVRGEAVRRWRSADDGEAILWTHGADGGPVTTLPPLARRWLQRWRPVLAGRTDARRTVRWWSLFRTESARSDAPRVLWGDLGREPRAMVLGAGDPRVPLNTCYVARCRDDDDAHAFAALLNSPLARAWLDAVAEPARGGYRRYLGWTISLLPLPRDWPRARGILAPLSLRARDAAPTDQELLDAALEAYGLDLDAVAPLVAWMAR